MSTSVLSTVAYKKTERTAAGKSASQKEWARGHPFFYNILWGHEAVAGLLLQHRADPNALDKYKHTPLNTTSAPFLLAWHPPHFTASEAVPNAQRKEQAFVLLPKKS